MNPGKFKNAYYIKLGKDGEWEESSIEENKARIGWGAGQESKLLSQKSSMKREFTVVIKRDEDGYFVGTVPQLRGCHTQ